MFSGIISHIAEVFAFDGTRLTIEVADLPVALGESIAVNGVCLTVCDFAGQHISFDLSAPTLEITNLANLQVGQRINIERALVFGALVGGHLVTGHVDTTLPIVASKASGLDWNLDLRFSSEHKPLLVPKGSITVNGVSLTIQAVSADSVRLVLIPETCRQTTLTDYAIGASLNIEFDSIAKTVLHQINALK